MDDSTNDPKLNSVFNYEKSAFQEIFVSSNEGIIVTDINGLIQIANPKAEELFGYEKSELQGLSVDNLVPHSLKQKHVGLRNKYANDPHPRVMGIGRDLLGQRKNGSHFPIEVSLSHTFIKKEMYVVSFIIDITRRKKAEDALKKSEEQLITYASELEQRVKKRTDDLKDTIAALESANKKLKKAERETRDALSKERELNELKSRFVSMASHEFRTPLSSILSSVSLIDKYIEKEMPDKAEKHIERIRLSVKNLTDILNDFLSLGKLEEGKIETLPERIYLRDFIDRLVLQIEGALRPEQKIIVSIKDNPEISTDEKLLRNILINLLSNASKYSSDGKTIHIKIEEETNEICFSVIDDGMGIPEDEQQHLFERFFRAKNATNIQGTGLGLNIVSKYVDLLKGKISFHSKLNQGTVFIFKLPKNYS